MAGGNPIKLFQLNQKYCRTFRIFVPQTNQNRLTNDTIKCMYLICLAQFGMASVAFLLYDANSMGDYGAAFFTLNDLIETAIAFAFTNWKIADILQFIANCEGFIEKRESRENSLFSNLINVCCV